MTMTKMYAMHLANADTLATYRGRVLVHQDGNALQRAFPGVKVVEIDTGRLGRPMLLINEHPDIAGRRNMEV